MKKGLLLTLLFPLLLTSCRTNTVSLEALVNHVNKIVNTNEHPYYKVNGSIDIAGAVTEISEDDGTFNQMPNGISYVANARYNEGFYNAKAERLTMQGVSGYSEEDIVIYGMSSRSYWTRMPLRLHQDNFYKHCADGSFNRSCGYSNLLYLIIAWADAKGAINASTNYPYYEILPDGGFAIGGDAVRTKISVDNYPYYMNFEKHPELGDEWDPDDPLPVYSCYANKGELDGKFNIRFEYDKNGWLKSEYVASADYDYRKNTQGQVAMYSTYTYRFS